MYHTKMIKNKGLKLSFSISFFVAMIVHVVILLFVKKPTLDFSVLNSMNGGRPIKIDRIQLVRPSEVEQLKMRRVGRKNGAQKDYFQPDLLKFPKAAPVKTPGLSLNNLAPNLPAPKPEEKKPESKTQDKIQKTSKPSTKTALAKNTVDTINVPTTVDNDSGGHFYFNPKKEKKIVQNNEQDSLKQEAYKNITTSNSNPVAQKLSNFEIRYERPEGVSEDELNSDEKAYYAFFKRSYASYLSKLYATYEKVAVERPALERAFESKHLLIGKIDYDDKGNIVTVKILKSSDNDDVHYFFEETLKQLNLPNPPKSFIKNKKAFSTYYQIQIN